ncbi:response regulator [Chthonobacter rhizosphaerae]|uniref:response regulator n=1 Tax=Chthonobacter rhizosphaerae TaxID=2735553 RepID=UPI0015EF85B1|nr:hypothetical protein [Chthonobacter rhizosphaerae]
MHHSPDHGCWTARLPRRTTAVETGRIRRAVVVEDNHVIALDLHDLLAAEFGCDVTVVTTNGIEAVTAIADLQPDLVVSDLSILLRTDIRPSDVTSTHHVLVVITGDSEAAARHGRDGVRILMKPYTNAQLVRTIEAAVATPTPERQGGRYAGLRPSSGGPDGVPR